MGYKMKNGDDYERWDFDESVKKTVERLSPENRKLVENHSEIVRMKNVVFQANQETLHYDKNLAELQKESLESQSRAYREKLLDSNIIKAGRPKWTPETKLFEEFKTRIADLVEESGMIRLSLSAFIVQLEKDLKSLIPIRDTATAQRKQLSEGLEQMLTGLALIERSRKTVQDYEDLLKKPNRFAIENRLVQEPDFFLGKEIYDLRRRLEDTKKSITEVEPAKVRNLVLTADEKKQIKENTRKMKEANV